MAAPGLNAINQEDRRDKNNFYAWSLVRVVGAGLEIEKDQPPWGDTGADLCGVGWVPRSLLRSAAGDRATTQQSLV